MRCKGCNAVMKEREIFINKKTGDFEELCNVCRTAIFEPDNKEDSLSELGIDWSFDDDAV